MAKATFQPILLGLSLVTCLFLPAATVGNASLSSQRQAFIDADRALQSGDLTSFKRLQAGLEDYPLYPYLLYRDLQQRMAENPRQEVRRFLKEYADSPVTNRLRAAWLKQLAQERRWRDFLKDYRPTQDTELACYQRQALLQTGQREAALHGIEKIWMSGRSLPDACDPVFAIWKNQGGFTRTRVWQRFALAMDAGERGLAGYLTGLMPAGDRALAELWLRVDNDPRLVLDAGRFDAKDPRTAVILLHGISRWSQSDSVSAAAALDTLKQRYHLPESKLIELERTLALFVATRGHPDALRRLTALPPKMVDASVQEWRVRIGLQRGDWQAALTWLDRMSPELRDSPPWQYWRARALEKTGRGADARRIYQRLAGKRDYYGFLAADRLGMPYRLGDQPVKVSRAALSKLIERSPGLQRARELYLLERTWEARTEWQRATREFDTDTLKTAAKLAQSWGWHSEAITTLARAGYWNDLELRFPLPYRDRVLTNARQKDIDPAWVYAVMRQESIFRLDAKSPAGALGLMQIMPGTGRRIAKDLQHSLSNNYALLHADTNILYGAHYLRHTLNELQGNPVLATAAYNAGPNRVAQWLPEQGKIDADVWAETIPYVETRNYVKRVLEYTAIYERRLGNKAASIGSRMAPISPSATD